MIERPSSLHFASRMRPRLALAFALTAPGITALAQDGPRQAPEVVAPPMKRQEIERHHSGGADLRANNPFAKPPHLRNPTEVSGRTGPSTAMSEEGAR